MLAKRRQGRLVCQHLDQTNYWGQDRREMWVSRVSPGSGAIENRSKVPPQPSTESSSRIKQSWNTMCECGVDDLSHIPSPSRLTTTQKRWSCHRGTQHLAVVVCRSIKCFPRRTAGLTQTLSILPLKYSRGALEVTADGLTAILGAFNAFPAFAKVLSGFVRDGSDGYIGRSALHLEPGCRPAQDRGRVGFGQHLILGGQQTRLTLCSPGAVLQPQVRRAQRPGRRCPRLVDPADGLLPVVRPGHQARECHLRQSLDRELAQGQGRLSCSSSRPGRSIGSSAL